MYAVHLVLDYAVYITAIDWLTREKNSAMYVFILDQIGHDNHVTDPSRGLFKDRFGDGLEKPNSILTCFMS